VATSATWVARPYGQDAVVVVAYARRPDGGVDVLVRACLRPGLLLVRDGAAAPLAEARESALLTELVAGIVEVADRGEAGLRARAAAELHEEAGFVVDPRAMTLLGAGTLPSPGAMPEKFYFVAVEVDPQAQLAAPGDGSPMEEGASHLVG
jgi:ADP-ribose pyrophosphatase